MPTILQSRFIELNDRSIFLRGVFGVSVNEVAIVILAPFGDEMNKSRHLYRELMVGLLKFDMHSFLYDPTGTGDSQGDLSEITLHFWQQELCDFISYLKKLGYQKICFVASRFSSLQLMDLLANYDLALKLEKIVLWQPYFEVKQFIQHIFRVKIAEQMSQGEKLKQVEIVNQLDNGQSVEIAGYTITKQFYLSLLDIKSFNLIPHSAHRINILWLDISLIQQQNPTTTKLLSEMASHFNVKYEVIIGQPWWNSSELIENQYLVDQSIRFLLGHLT
jgi:exosortase A-associated hydrolase 2